MKLRTALLASIFSTTFSAALLAAPAPIGVVSASGDFQVEGSRIWGNSTLFDGARVETGSASSELALSGGAKVQLGAASVARVFAGRLELERGTGQVNAKSGYRVGASGLVVEGSRYRVGITGDAHLEVTAMQSAARVVNARGVLVATVPAGRSMSFAMQEAITRNGCLLWKGSGFILQVDDSPEVLQLTGNGLAAPGLAGNVGNRVKVTGLPTGAQSNINPATSVVNVTELSRTSVGGCLTAAAALSAQTQMPANTPVTAAAKPGAAKPGAPAPSPAPAAKAGGMSTGAKVAIIGAIAGGGAGGAFAVLGNKKSSTSR